MGVFIMIIYKATNKINGKFYIGMTTQSLNDRKSQHKYCSNKNNKRKTYFNKAIKKYGFDNFEWEIIDESITLEDLREKEIFHIDSTSANVIGIGYNITSGGDGNSLFGELNGMWGKTHSPETLKKQSEVKKGKYKGKDNPNYGNGDKIRGEKNVMWGKTHNPEARKKISDARKRTARPVIIDGVYYRSIREASSSLKIPYGTIYGRVMNPNYPNYKYITLEEYEKEMSRKNKKA